MLGGVAGGRTYGLGPPPPVSEVSRVLEPRSRRTRPPLRSRAVPGGLACWGEALRARGRDLVALPLAVCHHCRE